MRLRILPLVLLLSAYSTLYGQTQLTVGPASAPSSASDCISTTQFQSVSLETSLACGTPVEVLYDKGATITGLGSPVDTIQSSPHTLQFDSVGVYSLVCSSKMIADQCYNVVAPAPIPTLGTWCLIILAQLLVIIGVVGIRSPSIQKA